MLTVSDLTKSFGGRVLFENASLQVNRGDRLGLIGPNGAGKTTLFSLILGENQPDSGSVALQRGVSLGFLPQESAPSGDETILELATAITPDLREARRLLRENPDEDTAGHHEGLALFAEHDGHAVEARAKRILAGLAFRPGDLPRPARELSGGWVMRAHLARLLVLQPDLLMLDEPTNHLDLETLGWFQNHLRQYPGAILAISHDREFLNDICQGILEIRHRKLNRWRGNYDAYLEQKAARDAQHLAAWKNQQREIAELQRFIDRFRAKASKASQAQDRIKQLARMERLDPPEQAEATVRFRFPQPVRSGHRVVRLTGVRQAYGSHVVYERLDLTVERGQRTVLVGPNGAGKSTLLKILAGLVPLSAGERELSPTTTLGYFAQHRSDMLQPRRTVLEEAMALPRSVPEQSVRSVLGSFLFRGEEVFKTVGVLSGGEKSRLALVKLLLDPPNLLLLDEPTTHLDMPSIDALTAALQQYEGTLLFVSHDVHFIRRLATTTLHIHAGQLTPYPGDYDYYLEKTGARSARHALVAALADHQPPGPSPAEAPAKNLPGMKEQRERRREEARRNQEASRQRREQEKRLHEAEAEVLALEATQRELTARLEHPDAYATPGLALELNRQLLGVTASLERANTLWHEAAAALTEPAE